MVEWCMCGYMYHSQSQHLAAHAVPVPVSRTRTHTREQVVSSTYPPALFVHMVKQPTYQPSWLAAYVMRSKKLGLCCSSPQQTWLITKNVGAAVLVNQGFDNIVAESLVAEDLPQSGIFPNHLPRSSLHLLCRLDARGARLGQLLLKISNVFSLSLPVPSFVISEANRSLRVLAKRKKIRICDGPERIFHSMLTSSLPCWPIGKEKKYGMAAWTA